MRDDSDVRHQPKPLNGWRAIADYLGRNQSTVKRWANDGGLPVHRPKGSASRKGVPVYAFAHELDIWLKGHQLEQETDDAPVMNGHPVVDREEAQATEAGQGHSEDTANLLHHPIGRRALLVGGLAAGAVLTWGLVAWQQQSGNVSVITATNLPAEARQLYLDAHYLWQQRTPGSLRQAEQLLLRVRQLAPRFGGAQANLATVYNLMVEYGVLPPQEGYDRSKAAAGLAIALNPDLAQAYSVLGDIATFWDRDYELGMSYFERALSLAPQDAQTHHWYASALMGLGRFEQAADGIIRAREIEPLSRSIGVSSAMIQLGLGQPDAARATLLQIIGNEPGYRSPFRFLSFAELARGDQQAYLDALETRFTLTGDDAGLAIVRAGRLALESEGSADMARAMMAATHVLPAGSTVEPYFLAHVLALAGNWEQAAQRLNETPMRHAFYYGIDPAFALARQDAAFLRMVGDFGLPVIRSSGL